MIIAGLFIASIVAILVYVWQLQAKVVETSALNSAALYSQALSEFRTLYTSEVIARLKKQGIRISHDYINDKTTIPLPATLSMLLGEKIGTHHSGAKTFLYSAYPFPWRDIKGGLKNKFAKAAWKALSKDPHKPFYSFEQAQGQAVLRYATADLMRPSCVSCHNSHPDSPKIDWKTGDLRGILEIVHPMKAVASAATSGFWTIFVIMLLIGIFGFWGIAYIIRRLQMEGQSLESQVADRTLELRDTNKHLKMEASQREFAEKQAIEISNMLKSLIETAADAIIIIDEHGIIESFNTSAESIFGYTSNDVVGKNVSCLMPDTIANEHDDFLNHYLNTGQGNIIGIGREVQARRKTGELFPAYISVGETKAGQHTKFTGILRDLTLTKERERETQEVSRQLQHMQKLESIGQLAGGIAHDFNNILAAIIGYAKLQSDALLAVGTDNQLVEKILDSANRAATLTQQLLNFSRKGETIFRPVDVNHCVNEAVALLEQSIHKNVTIKLQLADTLPLINADDTQLIQMFLNLGINAADAMPEGGQLTLQTALFVIETANLAHYPQLELGTYIHVTIRDTGAGMSTDVLNQIYEPFFTTKAFGKGTGLGLSVVYGIITEHHATITVDSTEGAGTLFNLYFPISTSPLEHNVQKEIQPNAKTIGNDQIDGITLLIVDDEQPLRELLETVFSRYACNLLFATNGEEAVTLYMQHHSSIDLIIMDIQMPVMGGYDAYQQIQIVNPTVPVIFMSGYTDEDQSEILYSLDNVTFIQKPYDLDALLNSVRQMLLH